MDLNGFKALEYSIPETPGVYRYYDRRERLLYVGKAKNLRKRVAQYFANRVDTHRIRLMVRLIERIEFTVVDTEHDALLLENVLIKKHQPRYNIRLKDDKTYPFLVLRNEPFPRLEVTRQIRRDGSRYYGPYSSPTTMYTLLDLIRKIYPLRTCALNLSDERISKAGYRPCLEHQLGNCMAPCAGLQSAEEYARYTDAVHLLLKGNLGGLLINLRKQIKECVARLDFEQAHTLKGQVELLERYEARSTVVSTTVKELDSFALAQHQDRAVVNHLHVRNGAVMRSFNLEIQLGVEEDPSAVMAQAMLEICHRYEHQPVEIVCNIMPESLPFVRIPCRVPSDGDKRKLVDLSLKNAFFCLQELLRKPEERQFASRSDRLLQQVQKDLQIPQLPQHIECFDNSHTQGSQTVSACVVFRNGRPAKRDYRLFNLRDVEGIDDFAGMEEVITRRYQRMLTEGQALPDLVIVDGGKGQLSSAHSALVALDLGHLPLMGIAKRLEALFKVGDPHPLMLDKKSPTLRLIQQMRDEAHRFGLQHHRNRRHKAGMQSALDNLKGIGPETRRKLLSAFGSAERVFAADIDQLRSVVGAAKAELIVNQSPRKTT
ncbi:MAG: excinuclease ABC subunit C [Sphingobacteriia bacterium]|nr:excinuclease ABC subunit C [Sphingobacteriia bacterium]